MGKKEQKDNKAKFASNHPFTKGASILAWAKWKELSTQHRASDKRHMSFVHRLFKHKRVTIDDFKHYKLLSKRDIQNADSPWLDAPTIVATNRERYTLIDTIARRFAEAKRKVVIRWPAAWKNWKQKPSSQYLNDAMQDPCFYEYFVEGAECFLSDRVTQVLRLVNAQCGFAHSLTVENEIDKEIMSFHMTNGAAGSVWTLAEPPASFNVKLDPVKFPPKIVHTLRDLSICEDSIVIPIGPQHSKDHDDVPVPGGVLFRPSKVTIVPRFPIELSFAITVNKAEGRTLKNVIIALSYRTGLRCNFDYRALYVSSSRVDGDENIRLLLRGDKETDKWSSLQYINDLNGDISVPSYFAGFSSSPNRNWETDIYNAKQSHLAYVNLIN